MMNALAFELPRSAFASPWIAQRRTQAGAAHALVPSLDSITLRGGAYVEHGSLSVAARGEVDFEAASAYLCRDSMMKAVIGQAESGARHLKLTINSHNDDSFDPNTNTIHWDPHSALKTTCGGTQSPALGLGHELDHATVNPASGDCGANTYDAAYDNAEEHRVIAGSETHAAKTLGEAVRYDHDGSCYRVQSPIAR